MALTKDIVALLVVTGLAFVFFPGCLAVGGETLLGVALKGTLGMLGFAAGLLGPGLFLAALASISR